MDTTSLRVLYTSLPGRYAKALFDEGKQTASLDEISEGFQALSLFFKNNPSLKRLLTSGILNDADSDSGWIAVGEHLSFCPVFLGFVREVNANRRFNILHKIQYIYNAALTKHKNRRNVVISSVVDLFPEQKEKIEMLVSEIFDEKPIIRYKLNPNLLGGLKISSEELSIDASVFSRIKQMSSYLKNVKIKVKDDED